MRIEALIGADYANSSDWRTRAAKRLEPAFQETGLDVWCRRLRRLPSFGFLHSSLTGFVRAMAVFQLTRMPKDRLHEQSSHLGLSPAARGVIPIVSLIATFSRLLQLSRAISPVVLRD